MKSLKYYILKEDGPVGSGVFSTPGNTMGMGDPAMPTDTQDGTDPVPTGKVLKQKRKKKKCKDCDSCK